MKKDRYITYLQIYFQKNGTINNIRRDSVVEFEGEKLVIGEFLANVRKQHKLYLEGSNARGSLSPLSLKRYEELEKLGIDWEPIKKIKKQVQENDECLDYILAYYNEHHTLKSIKDEVEIGGKRLLIKSYMSHRRINHRNYLQGINKKGSCGKTELERYKVLDSIGFEWTPKEDRERKQILDDKPMRYLELYFTANHGTFDNLPNVVEFEGVRIDLQQFLEDRRKKHRKILRDKTYTPSKLETLRQQRLEDMHYDFDFFEKKKEQIFMNDKYLRYLEIHFEKYGTINDIKSKQIVIFEGEELKIGHFISECRKKHAALVNGRTNVSGLNTPLINQRFERLEELGLDWTPSKTRISLAKIARQNKVSKALLRKYTEKFNGDYQKALKICKLQQSLRRQKKKQESISMETIRQTFDIDETTLLSTMNSPSVTTTTSHKPLMYSKNQTLRDYCIQNGLNYGVIYKAIRLKREGLCDDELPALIEEVLTSYKKKGQNAPSSWIYTKYGGEVLVRHLLTSMSLSTESILYDMSRNCIDIEEAIENDCFRRHITDKDEYLKGIYKKIISALKIIQNECSDEDLLDETITEYITKEKNEYSLTARETSMLKEAVSHYQKAIREYHLYDVGFAKTEEERQEKIEKYHLDEDEIEEAFYMPLKFDEKVLLGKESHEYQRRKEIKSLIMSWNYLSVEEQQQRIARFNITPQEQQFILEKRASIDKAKTYAKK